MNRSYFTKQVALIMATLNSYARWRRDFQAGVDRGDVWDGTYAEEQLEKKQQQAQEEVENLFDLIRGKGRTAKIGAEKVLAVDADPAAQQAASTIAANVLNELKTPEEIVNFHGQMIEEGKSPPVELREYERLARVRLRDEEHYLHALEENVRNRLSDAERDALRTLEQVENMEYFTGVLEAEAEHARERLEAGTAENASHLLDVWGGVEQKVWPEEVGQADQKRIEDHFAQVAGDDS